MLYYNKKKKCCYSSCATLVYSSASILSSAIQQFMAGIKVKETDTDSNLTERTISKGVVSLWIEDINTCSPLNKSNNVYYCITSWGEEKVSLVGRAGSSWHENVR